MRIKTTFWWTVATTIFMAGAAFAQMRPGRGFGPGGGDPNGLGQLKIQLDASDEEWKVIGPKVQKLIAIRTALQATPDSAGAVRGGRGDFGGRGGMGNDTFGGPADSAGGGRGGPGGRGGRGGRGDFGRGGFGPRGGGLDGFGPPTTNPSDFGPPEFARGGGPDGFGPGGRGGRGGPPGFGGDVSSAYAIALSDLKTATDDANTTPEQLKEKLAIVRAARQKLQADLELTQKDLRLLLANDQQAILIDLDYLD